MKNPRIVDRIAEMVHEPVPGHSTTEVPVSGRGAKVFLDNNQNDEADTLASVYSLRPYYLPLVSTPLSWTEVKKGLDPKDHNILTVRKRIQKKGDLFAGIFSEKFKAQNTVALKLLL